MLRRKKPRRKQLLFQPLKFLIELPTAVQQHLFGIELIFPIPLVHIHISAHDNLLPFRHAKRETPAAA